MPSSPRTSRARRSRRSSSTSSVASSPPSRSRHPASVTAGKWLPPGHRDPDGRRGDHRGDGPQTSTRSSALLGKARKIVIDKDSDHDRGRCRRVGGDQGPDQADQGRGREHTPVSHPPSREAPGAPRELSGGVAIKVGAATEDRDEGEEAPRLRTRCRRPARPSKRASSRAVALLSLTRPDTAKKSFWALRGRREDRFADHLPARWRSWCVSSQRTPGSRPLRRKNEERAGEEGLRPQLSTR